MLHPMLGSTITWKDRTKAHNFVERIGHKAFHPCVKYTFIRTFTRELQLTSNTFQWLRHIACVLLFCQVKKWTQMKKWKRSWIIIQLIRFRIYLWWNQRVEKFISLSQRMTRN